jgi:membrane associated rhomboid family serine protease
MSPLGLMVFGGLLLVASCLALLLMVIRVIPSSLLLSLVAYAASLGGIVVGIIGAVEYARHERRAH